VKILFVGYLAQGQTSRMRMETLRELGHDVVPVDAQTIFADASYLARRIQQRMSRGRLVSRLNTAVLQAARQQRPDLVWAEKQEYLRPDTLEDVQKMGGRLLHYTPDPYFSVSWKRTHLLDACLPLYDYAATSKSYELADYHRVCRQTVYMPLGFAEAVHRPVLPADCRMNRSFSSDVGFLGGWEPRREILLDAVARTGCGLKIWGYSWDHLVDGRWNPRRAYRLRMLAGGEPFRIERNARLAAALQGGEVYGDTYAWALSGARISVGFLRHAWPDQHTTRTFEIPACASMMIADRTEEHMEFFEEGKEAEFFTSEAELVEKVHFYLANESARVRIAIAGYERCMKSGYSYRERLRRVLEQLNVPVGGNA
jgi:spore maturation protein CgeB